MKLYIKSSEEYVDGIMDDTIFRDTDTGEVFVYLNRGKSRLKFPSIGDARVYLETKHNQEDKIKHATKIEVRGQIYDRLYEFDGGVYFVPENSISEESWIALMYDGSVELLFRGVHRPWKNARYEIIESED